MLVVLDTNVIVSGLLNAAGKPAIILDLVLDSRIRVAYDNRILGEYEDVLARPELHIMPNHARVILSYIELAGEYVEANKIDDAADQDRDDIPFIEVFITSRAQALITGNLRHFTPLPKQGLAVCNPAQFLDRFFKQA